MPLRCATAFVLGVAGILNLVAAYQWAKTGHADSAIPYAAIGFGGILFCVLVIQLGTRFAAVPVFMAMLAQAAVAMIDFQNPVLGFDKRFPVGPTPPGWQHAPISFQTVCFVLAVLLLILGILVMSAPGPKKP